MDKPKVSLSKIEQEIRLSDFKELRGVPLEDLRGLKESIGQALIDRIVERTESGVSVTGGKLKSPYSKSYQKSLEFKAAGKSANEINMTLTGDMLGSVDVEVSDDGLKIYVGEDQVPKAHGHLTGKNGEVPAMKRNWFGVTKKEVTEVLSQFADDIEAARALAQDVGDDDERPATIRAIDFLRDDFDED